MRPYFRIGGVHQDLPPKLIDDIEAWCRSVPGRGRRSRRLLTGNRIFKQRNVRHRVVTLKQAWEWGFSGVMVRGSGDPWICARRSPTNVRRDGFRHSVGRTRLLRTATASAWKNAPVLRIMRQCIDKLRAADGQGPVAVEDNKIFPPRRRDKRSMEALIHHFKLYTEGFHVPAGEVYAAVEAPEGRVRRLPGRRRHQQAYKMQDPRAGFRASCSDGFHLQGPPAGRRLGHPRSLDIVSERSTGGIALPPIQLTGINALNANAACRMQ